MLVSYIRTIVLYLALLFSIRMLGKRQVGQMEPSEFVVTMLLANLASIPMQESGIPLHAGLVPILTVLGAELCLSWLTMRSVFMRRLLCGKPVILIENGRLIQEHLKLARITLDELSGHLRLKDIMDMESVQYAILETNGSLSVFPYPKDAPASAREAGVAVQDRFLPVTLVEDGHIFRENLHKAGKDRAWLERTLKKKKAEVRSTLLLTVDSEDNITFIRKEGKG